MNLNPAKQPEFETLPHDVQRDIVSTVKILSVLVAGARTFPDLAQESLLSAQRVLDHTFELVNDYRSKKERAGPPCDGCFSCYPVPGDGAELVQEHRCSHLLHQIENPDLDPKTAGKSLGKEIASGWHPDWCPRLLTHGSVKKV